MDRWRWGDNRFIPLSPIRYPPISIRQGLGLDSIRQLFHFVTDFETIKGVIEWGGLLILIAIVFAETGLLIGFCLPGDSLLVAAGFVASTGTLDLWQILVFVSLAAIVGDSTGYAIGRKAGTTLYAREQSRWFRRDHLLATKTFYEKYGGVTIILARFMPFARTFAPVVAGIGEMNYRKFVTFNVVGGVGWVWSMSLLGYFFGQIPFVQKHIEKALLGIIALSLMPMVVHVIKARRHTQKLRGSS